MATINKQKIGSVASLAAGATYNFQWNNPPWDTVLGYFAYPVTPHVSGPHGAANGTVEITKVECDLHPRQLQRRQEIRHHRGQEHRQRHDRV